MNEDIFEKEQEMLDDVEELADQLGLSTGETLSMLANEKIQKMQVQLNEIDNQVFDIHKVAVLDEEEHIISPSKAEVLFAIIVFGFVFLLGMVLGGVVF